MMNIPGPVDVTIIMQRKCMLCFSRTFIVRALLAYNLYIIFGS